MQLAAFGATDLCSLLALVGMLATPHGASTSGRPRQSLPAPPFGVHGGAGAQLHPPPRWVDAWVLHARAACASFSAAELLAASDALMHLGHDPGKPWAAALLAAVEPCLDACGASGALPVLARSLTAWGCRPGSAWVGRFLDAAAQHMPSMSAADAADVLEAVAAMRPRPGGEWLGTVLAATQGLIASTARPPRRSPLGPGAGAGAGGSLSGGGIYGGASFAFGGAAAAAFGASSAGGVYSGAMYMEPPLADVCRLVRALASVGAAPPPVWVAELHALLQRFYWSWSVLQLCTVLASLREMGVPPSAPLTQQLVEVAYAAMTGGGVGAAGASSGVSVQDRHLSPTELVAVLLTCGEFGVRPDADWMEAWCEEGSAAARQLRAAASGEGGSGGRSADTLSALIAADCCSLLSAATLAHPPPGEGWVSEVTRTLAFGFRSVDMHQLLQLSSDLDVLGAVVEPGWVVQLVEQADVDWQVLEPQQHLAVLQLLSRARAAPPPAWWAAFSDQLAQQLPVCPLPQLLLLAQALCGLQGSLRLQPPQQELPPRLAKWRLQPPAQPQQQQAPRPGALLAAHEAAVLAICDQLNPSSWLALLACYAQLGHTPCPQFMHELQSATMPSLAPGGGSGGGYEPREVAALCGAVGRLHLALDADWADLFGARLFGCLHAYGGAWELSEVVEGLLGLEGQVRPTERQLAQLLGACQLHLDGFSASALTNLLLLAASGSARPSSDWLAAVDGVLARRAAALGHAHALLVTHALRALEHEPSGALLAALQARLLELLPGLSAQGLAAALDDLVHLGMHGGSGGGSGGPGAVPSGVFQSALGRVLSAQRAGVDAACAWGLLASLALMRSPPSVAVLDALLPVLQPHLCAVSGGSASDAGGSRSGDAQVAQRLQQLLLLLSSWDHYRASDSLLQALCAASMPHMGSLDADALLQALHRFARSGFAPPPAWMRAAAGRALAACGGWDGLDAPDLTRLLFAWGKLGHCPDYLNAWPGGLLARSHALCASLDASQLPSVLFGVAALRLQPPPEWRAAFETASGALLPALPPQRLALVAQALAGLRHSPSQQWLSGALSAASAALPRFTPGVSVLLLVALVQLRCRPDAAWLDALVEHAVTCPAGMGAEDALVLSEMLQELGYAPRPEWREAVDGAALSALAALGSSGGSIDRSALVMPPLEVRLRRLLASSAPP